MAEITFYISAASDLIPERDVIARAVAEIPLDLGWHIVQSPLNNEPLDELSLRQCDVHILILGGDIRAPIGYEWLVSRYTDRTPALFLKRNALRTPAAQRYVANLEETAAWNPYSSLPDLRLQVLRHLANQLSSHADLFGISASQTIVLKQWCDSLETPLASAESDHGSASRSSVILSREDIVSAGGVLIKQK